MSCREQLKKFLFIHARNISNDDVGNLRPVGLPLYAYRCTEKSYEELRKQVGSDLQLALRGNAPIGFEACFCLYAAETFRREHDGGVWTWRTVFDPLKEKVPANPVIVRWVEKGLKYWKRNMLEGEAERRLALATIACEGGLPLRLLQKEGANLRNYFRRMLQAYHERATYFQDVEGLARYQIHTLPQSLRNEEVVRLCATLIQRTVELQHQIGDAADPIAALDEQVEGWRLSLPLRLDDDIAAALFKNLVEESRAIASAIAARPAWRGILKEGATGHFTVSKELQFPATMPKTDLAALIGYEPKPRARLLLNTRYRSEPIVVLTEFPGKGVKEPHYRCEWLWRDGLSLTGSSVTQPHAVMFHDGQRETQLGVEKGEVWGESPWVFISTRNEGEWVWFSEGSSNMRAEKAIVVIPRGCSGSPLDDGHCERLGALLDPEREVFRITGSVDFITPEGDRYRVCCTAPSDTNHTPQLVGRQLPELLNQRPVYLGMPHFNEFTAGYVPRSADVETQWRPLDSSHGWVSDTSQCAGRVWIRLMDPVSGVERIRRLVNVVPRDFEIRRNIGNHKKTGYYQLRAHGLVGVNVLHSQLASVAASDGEDGEFVVDCPLAESSMMEPLHLKLEWSGGRSVILDLPYPQKGAMLQLDGRTLPVDELVALDRLYGLWVVVQNPSGGERFLLDVELVGGATGIGMLGEREKLPPLKKGELQVNLGHWTDRIKNLLAAKDDPHVAVRLSVRSQNGQDLARILVAHYDMEIQPIRISNSVCVPEEYLKKIGEDWQSRISLEMIPLWSPTASPRSLSARDDAIGQWKIPNNLAEGPWWIIGRDGEWLRFRPLLWTVDREAPSTRNQGKERLLGNVVREPDPEVRSQQIDEVLEDMCRTPVHPDWELLRSYVALTMNFPPNTLDVLRHLVRHPKTLAMASLMADDRNFMQIISFGDEMPFAWGLLPVEAWRQAAFTYFSHLKETLAEVEAGEEICFSAFERFRERASGARPYFGSLCDWLQEEVFPKKKLSNSELQLVRRMPDLVTAQIEMEIALLQARHDADEAWPAWEGITELADDGLLSERFQFLKITGFQRPVKCAPFVAAAIALGGCNHYSVTPDLVYQLRVIRAFDREWFDRAYALGLTLGLARDNWEGYL